MSLMTDGLNGKKAQVSNQLSNKKAKKISNNLKDVKSSDIICHWAPLSREKLK